jgi:hypothetical protein
VFGDRLLVGGPPFAFPEDNLYVSDSNHLISSKYTVFGRFIRQPNVLELVAESR